MLIMLTINEWDLHFSFIFSSCYNLILPRYFRCNFQYNQKKMLAEYTSRHQTHVQLTKLKPQQHEGEWITTELYSSECGSPQNRSRVATVCLIDLYPIIMPALIHIQVCICGVYIPREDTPWTRLMLSRGREPLQLFHKTAFGFKLIVS